MKIFALFAIALLLTGFWFTVGGNTRNFYSPGYSPFSPNYFSGFGGHHYHYYRPVNNFHWRGF